MTDADEDGGQIYACWGCMSQWTEDKLDDGDCPDCGLEALP